MKSMSFKINTIKCPQCGSTKQTTKKPNHYVCQSCQAEFVIISSNTPKQHVVTHTIDHKLLDILSKFKNKVFIFMLVFVGLLLAWGGLSTLFNSPSEVKKEYQQTIEHRRIVATTVYQGTSGPALLVTASEASDRRDDTQEILINVSSLLTDEKKQQQRLAVMKPRTSQPVQFKRLPDGDLYVVLMEAEAYRFNPTSHEFEAINQRIQEAHPQALSAGISIVKPCYDGLDGMCLELLSNNGIKYTYYPMLDQLILDSDKYDAGEANAKALAKQQQWEVQYLFKEVNSSSERKQAGKYLLKGMRPKHNGGPYRLGYLDIYNPSTDGFWIGGSKQLLSLSTGYAVYARWGNGYQSLEEMTPGKVYFKEAILAENEQQVLIRFDATPSEADRFIQSIDKQTGKVIWSRPITDFTALDRNGTYISAEGFSDGFLLIANVNRPSMVVNKEGEFVKVFAS